MNKMGKILAMGCLCCVVNGIESQAALNLEVDAPMAGVSVAMNNYYASRLDAHEQIVEDLAPERIKQTVASAPELPEAVTLENPGGEAQAQAQEMSKRSEYENVAISQVSGYVNIRQDANTTSSVMGKLYNNCAATILNTVDGEDGKWYQIQSGDVNGYIKAQYFVTGAEAEAKAKEVGNVYATVANANTLRLREEPSLDSKTLTLLSEGAQYQVIEEQGDFLKLAIDMDLEGYVFKEYVTTNVEFEQAVSLAEEERQKTEETQRKKEAEDAIKALDAAKKEADGKKQETKPKETTAPAKKETAKETTPSVVSEKPKSDSTDVVSAPPQASGDVVSEAPPKDSSPIVDKGPDTSDNSGSSESPSGGSGAVASATRNAVVAYAKQFLGNPYATAGTNLTTGTDCSGFTQAIFSHFGITIGRSSRDQAAKGKEIAVDAVQPGDLLFYASGNYINHVAIYIGGGQVIHSSNPRTGVVISPAHYRTPCKAVTFLN